MTINAVAKSIAVAPSTDGIRYGNYPNGDRPAPPSTVIAAALTALGGSGAPASGAATAGAAGTVTIIAPDIVLLHAVGTTHTDPDVDEFGAMGYHFDAGWANPSSVLHQYTALPAGKQVGEPAAAFLYEIPGSYVASVRAEDSLGEQSDKVVNVVVQDPDDAYPGTATVCISIAGNFTDAPAGASQLTSVPTSAAANTRYLFRKGEDYTGGNTLAITHASSGGRVGAFGASGARPKINISTPAAPPTNSQSMLRSYVVHGCDVPLMNCIFGDYVHWIDCTAWNQGKVGSNLYTPAVAGSSSVQYYAQNPPANTAASNSKWPVFPAWWNCDLRAVGARGTSDYCAYVAATHMVMVGCRAYDSGTHDFRFPLARYSFIAHNKLSPVGTTGVSQIKLHARGAQEFTDSPATNYSPCSEFNVIADNLVDADDNAYQINPSPQNDQSVEWVRDTIVARPIYAAGGGGNASQRAFNAGGTRITLRDPTIGARTATQHTGVNVHMGAMGSQYRGPYFLPPGDPLINGTTVFAHADPIYPDKAGT